MQSQICRQKVKPSSVGAPWPSRQRVGLGSHAGLHLQLESKTYRQYSESNIDNQMVGRTGSSCRSRPADTVIPSSVGAPWTRRQWVKMGATNWSKASIGFVSRDGLQAYRQSPLVQRDNQSGPKGCTGHKDWGYLTTGTVLVGDMQKAPEWSVG